MEDVKLELRRRYDLKTTKVALVRWGLRELIDDYRQQGEHSRLVTRLKAQRTIQDQRGASPASAEEDPEHSV